MEQNLLFILTEGSHDAAFLYRILKTCNFKTYNKIIKEYPKPLNDLLARDLLNMTIPEVKIQEARSRFLPSYVMQKENDLIIIYSIGGDSKSEMRKSLLKTLNILNEVDPDAVQVFPNTNISVLYFFDADKDGTSKRMKQVIEECKGVFTQVTFENEYDSKKIHLFEDMKVGAYVFRKEDVDEGMLEDIMIPLMRLENEDIFTAAESFLTINKTCSLFSPNLKVAEDGSILKVNGQKYSHKKSLIGTVGQLQKSGKSNTVCISDTDYLTDEKIKGNKTCQEIIKRIVDALK